MTGLVQRTRDAKNRTGSFAKGTQEAHRSPCCSANVFISKAARSRAGRRQACRHDEGEGGARSQTSRRPAAIDAVGTGYARLVGPGGVGNCASLLCVSGCE